MPEAKRVKKVKSTLPLKRVRKSKNLPNNDLIPDDLDRKFIEEVVKQDLEDTSKTYMTEGKQKKFEISQVASMFGLTTAGIRKNLDQFEMSVSREKAGNTTRRKLYPEDVFKLALERRARGLSKFLDFEETVETAVICVYSLKGGVGKSTISKELICALQLLGLRVLGIDIDGVSSLTTLFGYEPEVSKEIAQKMGVPDHIVVPHMVGSLLNIDGIEKARLKDVVKKPFGEHGPHLIPSNDSFSTLSSFFYKGDSPLTMFSDFLQRGYANPTESLDLNNYDVILFDCGGDDSIINRSALAASDLCIAPTELDSLSIKGISNIMRISQKLSEYKFIDGHELKVVANCYTEKQVNRVKKFLEVLHNVYEDKLSKIYIPETETLQHANARFLPSFFEKPSSNLVSIFKDLAEESIEQIARMRSVE